MSVRVYQLSKEIGMDNAELIELLRERGFQVRSASSTVDNISADSLREEFAGRGAAAAVSGEAAEEVTAEAEEKSVPKPELPAGAAIVRSKEDIERERREREEAEREKQAPKVVVPPPPVGKAPPPLPRGPAVTIRTTGPREGAPPPVVPVRPIVRPGAPVLRTDLPREAPKPAVEETIQVPESAPSPVAPRAPETRAPAPKLPPVMPPPVSVPKKIVPPPLPETGSTAAAAAEDGESAGEARALIKLQVKSPIVVRDFAVQIGKKPFQVISELMEQGIFASMNTAIDEEIAVRIARNHGIELEVRHRGEGQTPVEAEVKEKAVDESQFLEPRPPIVCILGHVDHGKTTLLDTIRKTNVVAGEAGGITQHIGAYQVEHNGKKITFIDTPGHAAFSNMRARGANTTDIAVLVVAADDGFMPQTDEALGHARSAKVPVVVAINKMDAPGANVDRVKRQMQERGLSPEDWGGETLSACVSALKGDGIEALLEAILLQAEVTDGISANPNGDAEGVVLEAQKELGRGSTASVIVQRGTLKPGMALVCGEHYCRVRQLIDDKGKQIKSAGPSTPVKVVGWSGPPDAGDSFHTVKNERMAKREAEENELARKRLEAASVNEGRASVDDLFAAIARTRKAVFRVVVKADVYGTAEALATSLLSIKSDKIDLEVVDTGVGDVTKNDVLMASASDAAIIGFNVGVENGVPAFAKHHGVTLYHHNIIYELITIVKDAMADLLEPELKENKIGAAEVRQIFPLAKSFVAGCMVTEGRVHREKLARLMRKGSLVAESRISALKRFKDDVTEVRAGYECGIQLDGVSDYRQGDMIEVFEILKIKPSL